MSQAWKNNVNPAIIGPNTEQAWKDLVAAKQMVRDLRKALGVAIATDLGSEVKWNDNYDKLNVSAEQVTPRAAAPVQGKEDLVAWLHAQRNGGYQS